jgi:hypothetical protein
MPDTPCTYMGCILVKRVDSIADALWSRSNIPSQIAKNYTLFLWSFNALFETLFNSKDDLNKTIMTFMVF